MARNEQDREDLMREATGLSPRAEITASWLTEPLVFGFRKSGGLSLYFGADPVYQFNSDGQLRRAYVDGKLLKADQGKLVSITRDRNTQHVTLWSSELSTIETLQFLEKVQARCEPLMHSLAAGEITLLTESPTESNALNRLQAFLAKLTLPPPVASRAHSA